MTNTLANLARMTTSTTGTGTITLGSAVDGFLAFADELSSGDVITYAIEDGNQREIGQGTFTISGATHTLTRSTVYASTQGGSQISLSGSAQVFVTPAKQDLDNVMTDDERTKLAGIEAGATADQTGAEIVTAINSQLGGTDWQTQASPVGSGDIYALLYADIASDTPSADPDYYRTERGLWKKEASEPSHSLKVQNGNSTWYSCDEPILTPSMAGLVGDGSDETSEAEDFIAAASALKRMILWQGENIGFTNIGVGQDDGYYHWRGQATFTQLSGRTASTDAIALNGIVGTTGITLSSTAEAGTKTLSVSSASGMEVGDLLDIETNRLLPGDHRFAYVIGQLVEIVGISGTTITISDPLRFDLEVATITTGTAQAGASGSITLAAGETVTEEDITGRLLTITGGTGSGQTKWVQYYDSSTKVVDIGTTYTSNPQSDWSTNPDNTSEYSIGVATTMRVIKPARTMIDGDFTVKGYAASGVIVRGMSLFANKRPQVRGVTVMDCSNNGFYVNTSYEPMVSECRAERANYVTSGGSGLGYGFYDINCWNATFDRCTAVGCRTGFDAIGTSIGTRRQNCIVYGGGPTYDGATFFPESTRENSGFSSHTGAVDCITQDCIVIDCDLAGKQRGLNEVVQNCTIKGAANNGWFASYSPYVVYRGLTYDDGWTYWPVKKDDDGEDGILTPNATQAGKRLLQLVGIRHGTMPKRSTVVVQDCVAKAVEDSLVYMSDASTDERHAINLIITNNVVAAIRDPANNFHVLDASGNFTMRGGLIMGNVLQIGGNLGIHSDNLDPHVWIDKVTSTDLIVQMGPTKWLARIADDNFVSIPTGIKGPFYTITAYDRDNSVTDTIVSGLFKVGTTTALSSHYTNNVGMYNSAIGGTGGTDGQLNVSTRTDDRIILENRLGSTKIIVLELTDGI